MHEDTRLTTATSAGAPVLIVEDNREMQNFIAGILEQQYQVEIAGNGKEGYEKACAYPPDLIISDVMMPVMSGAEMVRKLKEEPRLAAVPIIMLTAKADDELKVNLLRSGVQDYLTKPFSQEELLARVSNLVVIKTTREVLQKVVESKQLNIVDLANDLARQKVHLEAALKDADCAKENAYRASEVKTQFLANMSHEIRTPLGVIIGFTEILLKENIAESERTELLKKIELQGTHLLSLISEVLDLSKVEIGHIPLETSDIHIDGLLNELKQLITPLAERKGLRFEIKKTPQVPNGIHADKVKLKQILINLANNAIKFTERGSVSLTIDGKTLDGAEQLVISMSDCGPGINHEHISHLFEPFFQVDSSMSRSHGGAGLGLALSRRLARIMGGELLLEKSGPEGCVFTLQLPNVPVKSPPPAIAPKPKTADLAGVKILLAEDAPDNRYLVSHILKRAGATVEAVENGKEAVQKALAGNYDVVLMDIQMPIMDGYQATRELRHRGYKKPIVALTAHALKEDRERCLNAGCDEYLSKPINSKSLLETIQARLNA